MEDFEENLPKVNPNEDLETKSNKKFQLLFSEGQFEIRPENLRDKGIDFFVELKKNERYTGFRFAVQLKATAAPAVNSDGSISFPFESKNINYIISTILPGYYFLYDNTTNTFYYDSVTVFARSLYEKDEAWLKQQTHSLRFVKKVDSNAIEEIFRETEDWFKAIKKIHEKTILQQISLNRGDKVIVDANLNVTNDADIRRMVEALGMDLINEGKWTEILLVHSKATGNVAITGQYNLILGIANYYNGNLFDALSFFKRADKLKSDLSTPLQHHLLYFDATVKYSVGIISKAEYEAVMSELNEKESIGLYIKLERAKRNFLNSTDKNLEERYFNYDQEIQKILDSPEADSGIKLNARCELLLYHGFQTNIQWVQGVARTNAFELRFGLSPEIRKLAVMNFLTSKAAWHQKYSTLKDEALEARNQFVFFNAIVNYVKVNYEMLIFTDIMSFVVGDQGNQNLIVDDKGTFVGDLLDKVDDASRYFTAIGHVENTIASLSTKFELLHYSKKYEEAQTVMSQLEDLVNSYDLPEFKRKLSSLKNNGTTHETFLAWLSRVDEKMAKEKEEVASLVSEMKQMDTDELLHPERQKATGLFRLFP